MLMGERVKRKISNVGIHFDNNIYASLELEAMRKRRSGLNDDVQILADPTDRGHLWVLDTVERRWMVVPAVNQRISRGLNKFASRVVMRMARKMSGKGEVITDAHMLEARERCEAEARTEHHRSALRFCSDGALATNLIGNNGILAVLTSPFETQPSERENQGVLFPDLAELPTRTLDPVEPGIEQLQIVYDTAAAEGLSDANLSPSDSLGVTCADPVETKVDDDICNAPRPGKSRKPKSEPKGMGALRSLIGTRSQSLGVIK